MLPAIASRRQTVFGALAGVAAAMVLAGCGELVEVAPREPIHLPEPEQTSVVVDAAGEPLAELHAEHDREVVDFARLPQVLIDATVAIEDQRFFSHGGVDAPAVLRALGVNLREGRVVQGGSTITQQLAKVALVGSEQTAERKLTEATVAWQLESQLSKEEILAQYLNTVYFGAGAYGAQTAARAYFDVDVDQLSLPQAATLAGLLRAPSRDNPLADPERAAERRDVVLDRMVDLDMIDAADAQAVAGEPVAVSPPEPRDWRARHFVDHVLETIEHDESFALLGDTPGERAQRLRRGGLRVETTLDPDWQAAAEEAVATTLSEPADPHAAVVAIDPRSGAVRAMVGGRDASDATDPADPDSVSRLNLATKARRQPGSVFKPLTLAAAVSQGHSLDARWQAPATLELPADPPEEPEPWTVANNGDAGFGELDLRAATRDSVNTVYAQLVEATGPAAVSDLARRAGVDRTLPPVRSISLGSVEVSPLEMARVNATFAARGVRHDTRVVERILDPDGDVVWSAPDSQGSRAMDEAVSWLVTDALRGVVTDGTGEVADLDRPLAGKTGTTDDYADAWFAGYTPDMAMAVWVGFPQGRVSMVPPRTRRRVEGGGWPAEIFRETAESALADTPPRDFPEPRGSLATVTVDATRGCLPNRNTEPGVVEEHTYVAGTQPSERCTEPTSAPTVSLPDVTGQSVERAEELLRAAAFSATTRSRFDPGVPVGTVLEQSPEPGEHTLDAAAREVQLWVATHDPESVDVPDVLGVHVDEALATLERGGFAVRVDERCPDGGRTCAGARERVGLVWQQEPGDTAHASDTIELSAYPDGLREPGGGPDEPDEPDGSDDADPRAPAGDSRDP